MTLCKAGLFGVEGVALSDEEKAFFTRVNPVGYILFGRNCESPAQITRLVASLRALGDTAPLILIDQEGGRVARLKPPHWRRTPPARVFCDTVASDAEKERLVYDNARLIARELYDLGINVDCAPLADVPVAGAHDVIGDRAYSSHPQEVALLAAQMARGLLDGGVLPVLKHLPGHGRAHADSHEELPVVEASLEVLRATDFVPFVALHTIPLGMTAHILYTAIDAERPATLSPVVLELVRKELGFDGLLMSDDVSMKALKGGLGEITRLSLEAGCDLALHCNGKMAEMQDVAAALLPLSDRAQERLARARKQLTVPKPFDYTAAEMHLDAALGFENAPRLQHAGGQQ
jgi:beta-N-acetylhexosaminidase